MDNKYFFLHVPKTAGTSLFKVFNDILGEENVKQIDNLNSLTSQIEILDKYQFIGGHFSYSDYLKYIGKDRYSITFLRNPIERFISQYYYLRNNVAEYKFGYVANAKELNLKSYTEHYRQVQRCGDVLNRQLWHFAEVGNSTFTENELLEEAKENLSKINFVGICEEMADSIDLLCYDCMWPLVNNMPVVNVTNKKPIYDEIDKSTLEMIKEVNDLDLQLYEYGIMLFNNKKRQILQEAVKTNYKNFHSNSEEFLNINEMKDLPQDNESINLENKTQSNNIKFESGELRIVSARVYNSTNGDLSIEVGEEAFIEIIFKSSIIADNVVIGFAIENEFGQKIYGTNNLLLNEKISVKKDETYCVIYSLNMNLTEGKYKLNIALHSDKCYSLSSELESPFHKFLDLHLDECYHCCNNICEFRVVGFTRTTFEGLVKLEPSLLSSEIHIMDRADKETIEKISLKIKEMPDEVYSESLFFCEVDIMNCSSKIIDSTGENPVHISYHWFDEKDNTVIQFDGERTNMTPPLLPFNHREYKLRVISPKKEGKYRLMVTLVQEGVSWLEEFNNYLAENVIIEVKRDHISRFKSILKSKNSIISRGGK